MGFKNLIKKYIDKTGYKIVKPNLKQDHLLRRMKLIETHNINLILDVGASIGQYASTMRQEGYKDRIVSFEPRSSAYEALKRNFQGDNNFQSLNIGLGNFDGESVINISGNPDSSSFLDMLPSHIAYRPGSKYVGSEEVNIRKLDSVFTDIYNDGDSVFLKIDAQGFEYNIIEGATESLKSIKGMQLEMSIEPLYEGEKLFCEMIEYLAIKGYRLMSIEPGSVNYYTGQMLQIEGIFFRGI